MEHRRSTVVAEVCKKLTLAIGFLGLAIGLAITGCSGGGNNSGSGSGGSGGSALVSAKIAAVGNWTQGEQGAQFTVTVTNATGNTLSLAGLGVQVMFTNIQQFVVTSESGTGWSCPSLGGNCSRTDNLAAGASYPAITITGNLQGGGGSEPIGVTVQVSTPDNGGGSWSFTNSIAIGQPISVSITQGATASVNDGASATLNASVTNDSANAGVTWTVNGSGKLTNSSSTSVTYTAPASGSGTDTVTATSVTDATKSASIAISYSTGGPPAIAVAITNPISTIAPGAAAVTLNATVQNDSSNSGVTWTLTAGGNNCSPTCGALSAETKTSAVYTPPSSAPSSPDNSPTIAATSAADKSASASDAFSITSSSSGGVALLKGSYAFLVSGNNSAVAASIYADGTGKITGGEEDIQTPGGTLTTSSSIAVTSGTYTVGSDNRGTLSYTDGNGNTFTFAIALGSVSGGVATKGQMIEFDTNPLEMTGSLALQSSTGALSGSYAFGWPGWDGNGDPSVLIGSFTVSGGVVSNGLADQNDNGSLGSAMAFTGSTSAPDSRGRGTLTINAGGSSTSVTFYMVSASHAFCMFGGGDLYSGQMLQQTGEPYSAASLSGAVVLADQSTNGVPSPHAMLGLITFDSANSTASYSFDIDDGGGADQPMSGSGVTYSVTSATNGRVTVNPGGGASDLILYMIAPDKAFVGGTNQFPDFGTVEPQSTGAFSNSSVSGSYFFGTLPIVSKPSSQGTDSSLPPLQYSSGMIALNGTDISGTADTNSSGTLTPGGAIAAETYTVSSTGRVTFGSGDPRIAYIVSGKEFYFLNFPSGAYANPTIGIGEQ